MYIVTKTHSTYLTSATSDIVIHSLSLQLSLSPLWNCPLLVSSRDLMCFAMPSGALLGSVFLFLTLFLSLHMVISSASITPDLCVCVCILSVLRTYCENISCFWTSSSLWHNTEQSLSLNWILFHLFLHTCSCTHTHVYTLSALSWLLISPSCLFCELSLILLSS